eukprot:11182183-Lingulodinium_polyedra.AAC.1
MTDAPVCISGIFEGVWLRSLFERPSSAAAEKGPLVPRRRQPARPRAFHRPRKSRGAGISAAPDVGMSEGFSAIRE